MKNITRYLKSTVVTPFRWLALLLAMTMTPLLASAASGTWTNNASGVWSDTTSWLNGTVADGTDATADFSTIDITAPRTVTLDASHSLGTLLFGDSGGTLIDLWTLNASVGSILTLSASGTPTITVNNDALNTNVTLLNVPLAGSSGLAKTGGGTLVLGSANNSYTGATTISAGTLRLTNAPSTGPLLYMSFDNVSGTTVVNDGSMGAAANGIVVGTNVSIVAGGRYGNALQVGGGPVSSGGVFINNAVTLLNNTNNTTVNAWTVAMWVKTTTTTNGALLYQGGNTWASGNTRFYLAGNVNDTGGPFFGGVRNSQAWEVGQTPINDGNWHFVAMTTASGNVKKIYVDGNLDAFSATNNNNGWTNNATGNQVWIGGGPNISDNNVGLNGMIDEVYIYNRALSQLEITNLLNTSSTPAPQNILPAATAVTVATASKLDLNGLNATVTGLSGNGTVDNTLTNAGAPPITPTLTINSSSDTTFTGIITNSAGVLSVVKAGASALTLSNLNGYTGSTIVNSGTLNINHPSAIGTTGPLMFNGGTIDNTSGTNVTVVNNRTETWGGDFAFTGTTNLSLGTGAVTLAGPGTNRTVTVNANTLTVGSIGGTTGPGYGLVKAGAGTLQMAGGVNGTIAGSLTINGGKVQMTSDFTTTGLYGTGVIETTRGVNKWLFVNNPVDETFLGVIQTSPGATARELGLNKGGVGTLTLPSVNTFNDQMTVNQGVLKITGSISNGFGNAAPVQVGYTASQKAVLSIAGGSVYAGKTGSPSVSIAPGANFIGALNLSAGSLTSVSEIHVGNGNGATNTLPYAGLTMSGGTLTCGSYFVVAFNNDRAVFNQSGGTALVTVNVMTIGAGGANSFGVANLSGGSFAATNSANGGTYVGENGLGILNVSGTAAVTNSFNGLILGRTGTGSAGIVNLLGGKLNVNKVIKGAGSATFNFNGGTLQANVANATFMTGLNSAYVYGGGAIIDDGGFDTTIGQQLLAPSGNGVVSIPVTAGGSGYIDTPIVLVTNIDGSGMTASAQIDYALGTVTNILVTCPGNDYSTPPTVVLFGGGGTGATLGTPTLAANASGGLTKSGAGSLTLAGGSTYTGSTVVNGGTLNLNSSLISPATFGALIINNATVNVDATSGTPLPASNVTVTNGSLTLSPLSTASALNATGNLSLQNNAVLNLNFGALTANPTAPAINVVGGLSAPGSTIAINISALGMKPGQFTLIKYTGATLANLANFTLNLPAGVIATLVNNTGNHSIDLNITLSPKFLTWFGTWGTNWDISTTVNWKDGVLDTVYQQYTNGASIVGDAVQFDDTLTNDFVNPQPTNINLTLPLYSFPVIVDSTLPYSFSGPGNLNGNGYLVKTNTGTLTLNTSNSYTGGTVIGGGFVIITNDSALGGSAGKLSLVGGGLQANANTTNATRTVSVTAASTIGVITNATLQLGGTINGVGGLTKVDNGTLSLTGSNGLTGNLSVNQGTLRSAGTEVLPAVVRVGNAAGLSGVLTVPSGTFAAANNGGQFSSSLIAGAVATSAGDIVLNGGTLNVMQQLGLGAGAAGYGAMTMSSGTLNCGSYIVVGFNGDRAVYNQSGGTTTISSNLMTIAAGGTASVGVANISGGTFTSGFGLSSGIMVGERGVGTLNVSGAAIVNVPTNAGVTIGPVATQTGWDGTLNLNGGTITANRVARGAGTGAARMNMNGGTLKASTGNVNFLAGLDSATVYANGVTFDDGGFAITVAQPLQAPSGYGVSAITVANGGAGYIDSPIVTISGGSGSNATATATVSGGVVTGVTVTCPGTGYASGEVLTVTFDAASGGAGVTAATANAPVLAPDISGGLTKKGAGTLNLTGANTFTNTIAVTAGTLLVSPANQGIAPVTVASNTAFGVLVNSAGAATVGKLALGSTTLDRTTLLFALATGNNPISPVLQSGAVTLTGTNTVRISGTVAPGTFPLLQYAGTIGGTGSFNTNVIVPQGQVAILSNSVASSTLFVTVVGLPGIVWSGTNAAAGQTSVWNLNTITNWLAAGVPTTYQETTPPGDPVTFNDIGNGLVLLSNTASPASILISNNAVAYTFRGTGRLSGSTGLLKQGSGTATISLAANDYTGNTTISGGTLQLGGATTIPDGAGAGNLIINSAGKLDLNGFSETINGLNGSGVIDNSSGTASVLTLGNGNGAVTWGGSITNSASGGSSLIKIGTNSMVVTGTNYLTSTAASQINGGSLLITNGGALYMSGSAEFWVMQNAGTASVVVDGGTLVTSNNWLVIGRNNTAAIGTLTVNSGLVQKAGANNIVVGSLAANGTLIVNGGQVLNNGNLWLGENTGANAVLYLNGGLVQATQVRINGTTPASSIAYLNGGTLQATSGSTNYFIGVAVNIMAGGLIFDDGGFAVTNATQFWADGDGLGGGLVKKGAGTLYLDTANAYTGTTLVTNGTLAGIGSVTGPMVVAPAGNLGAGDVGGVGTFTINNSLTLRGNASMRVNKTGGTTAQDNIVVAGNISYGGILTVTNITSDANVLTTSDSFQLFSVTGSKSGNFTSIVGSPGPGLAYNFTPASGVLSIVTSAIASNPTNITFAVSGNTLTLGWPEDHRGWILQAQTNSLNAGLNALAGAWFDVTGSSANTNAVVPINPVNPTVFYRLRHP